MTDAFLHIACPRCDSVNRVPAARRHDHPTCGHCKAQLFDGAPLELTAANFNRHVTASDVPVLVDFWAPWCGPCRMMAPAYEAAAKSLEPDFRVAKLNTEEAESIAAAFSIRSIPTLALFKGGREVARQAGAMDQRGIEAWARRAAAQP